MPLLALESNGLRVLVRLGYAPEHRNYATTYKKMQRALAPQLPSNCDALIRAYQLLRQHGQETVQANIAPYADGCPLAGKLSFYRRD